MDIHTVPVTFNNNLLFPFSNSNSLLVRNFLVMISLTPPYTYVSSHLISCGLPFSFNRATFEKTVFLSPLPHHSSQTISLVRTFIFLYLITDLLTLDSFVSWTLLIFIVLLFLHLRGPSFSINISFSFIYPFCSISPVLFPSFYQSPVPFLWSLHLLLPSLNFSFIKSLIS